VAELIVTYLLCQKIIFINKGEHVPEKEKISLEVTDSVRIPFLAFRYPLPPKWEVEVAERQDGGSRVDPNAATVFGTTPGGRTLRARLKPTARESKRPAQFFGNSNIRALLATMDMSEIWRFYAQRRFASQIYKKAFTLLVFLLSPPVLPYI
jgi:hypothetical protein